QSMSTTRTGSGRPTGPPMRSSALTRSPRAMRRSRATSAALTCARCWAGQARPGAANREMIGWSWCAIDRRRVQRLCDTCDRDHMSVFVELPERLYQQDAFAAFEPVAEFSLGTARAMAWMSQLAYEGDQNKIERLCSLWGLRRPRAIVSPAGRRSRFVRT